MINKKVEEAINNQIVREIYSSNLYLQMAAYFSKLNLKGFANWMRVQTQEEMAHALKLYDYLLERGGNIILDKIDAPPFDWNSPLDVFEASYKHEIQVTKWINEIADVALETKDHATSIFMQWFITEQVEEEANVSEIVDRLKLISDSKSGLFMIDNELKLRVFVPPPAN